MMVLRVCEIMADQGAGAPREKRYGSRGATKFFPLFPPKLDFDFIHFSRGFQSKSEKTVAGFATLLQNLDSPLSLRTSHGTGPEEEVLLFSKIAYKSNLIPRNQCVLNLHFYFEREWYSER